MEGYSEASFAKSAAMSTRVFVGNLNRRATERDVEKFFRGYGKIQDVILKTGFGFVVR